MPKPGKSNGALTKAPDGRSDMPNKLSSGILGMRFMQQEAGNSDEASKEASSMDSNERSQHKFNSGEDPGRWSAPGVSGSLDPLVSKKNASSSIGYADIFGKGSELGGRRTYGSKPKRMDPEEMVEHYDDKRTKKTEKQKQSSRKRLSSEHAETRSDTRSKQRRRS